MIYHVLKDGSRVDSIKGIVIKADQFPLVYRVIDSIEERGEIDGQALRKSQPPNTR